MWHSQPSSGWWRLLEAMSTDLAVVEKAKQAALCTVDVLGVFSSKPDCSGRKTRQESWGQRRRLLLERAVNRDQWSLEPHISKISTCKALVHLKARKSQYPQIQEIFLAHESQYILGQSLWIQQLYYEITVTATLWVRDSRASTSEQRRLKYREVMEFAKLQSCKQSWD